MVSLAYFLYLLELCVRNDEGCVDFPRMKKETVYLYGGNCESVLDAKAFFIFNSIIVP